MNEENAKLLEAYPHLTRDDLAIFDAGTKARLLKQSEVAKAAPLPKIEVAKTAPPVTSLLLAHRVASGGSIISKSGRGILLPNDPITLDDLGPGGVEAWQSLVKRGKIALHPDLADPGDGGDDGS